MFCLNTCHAWLIVLSVVSLCHISSVQCPWNSVTGHIQAWNRWCGQSQWASGWNRGPRLWGPCVSWRTLSLMFKSGKICHWKIWLRLWGQDTELCCGWWLLSSGMASDLLHGGVASEFTCGGLAGNLLCRCGVGGQELMLHWILQVAMVFFFFFLSLLYPMYMLSFRCYLSM